jgi:type II secretory pathway pseudopilin PulG
VRPVKWSSVGAVIGALAAIAGIWFSSLSVYQQLRQQRVDARVQRQASAAAQLGLLTQLTASARAAFAKINAGDLPEKACTDAGPPTKVQEADIIDALATLDYLAWLQINGQMKDLPQGERFWRPSVVQAHALAGKLVGADVIAAQFPSLAAYIARLPRATRAPSVCS